MAITVLTFKLPLTLPMVFNKTDSVFLGAVAQECVFFIIKFFKVIYLVKTVQVEEMSMNEKCHRKKSFLSLTLPYRCNSYKSQVSQKYKFCFFDTWLTKELHL